MKLVLSTHTPVRYLRHLPDTKIKHGSSGSNITCDRAAERRIRERFIRSKQALRRTQTSQDTGRLLH